SNHNDSVILAEGRPLKPGESIISPAAVVVTPGYFEAMQVGKLRGRFFDDRDSHTDRSREIAIVDDKLARRFWPDQDPIGRRLYFPSNINDLLAVTRDTEWFTVVGVVRDVKLDSIVDAPNAVGAYYFPHGQRLGAARALTFAVRTAVDPNSLTNAV